MLPNLIIIGAPKAGTTALHHYLGLHPEISMSEPKELKFFDRNWHRGRGWYESFFTQPARVRGEASVSYARFPICAGVPERMARLVPDAKLVYLVRDPLPRLLAEYEHKRGEGLGSSLEACLAAGPDAFPIAYSRYAFQLDQYDRYFAPEQLLVVDQHELRHDRESQLTRVLRFLGVDAAFRSPAWAEEHNRRFGLGRQTAAGRGAWRVFERGVGHDRAHAAHGVALNLTSRVLGRAPRPPELAPRHRRELEALFRDDADRLRARTGLPLRSWSV